MRQVGSLLQSAAGMAVFLQKWNPLFCPSTPALLPHPTLNTEMDQVGLQQCSTSGKVILFGLVALFMANGAWLLANGSFPPVVRAAGAVQVRLGRGRWAGAVVGGAEQWWGRVSKRGCHGGSPRGH